MARKRASLKDKGAETLGLTPKKGQGIDVLFGGPAEPQPNAPVENTTTTPPPQAASAPVAEAPSADQVNDLSGLLENPVETPAAIPSVPTFPAMPDSLPVNEADDDAADVIKSETMADDLDLPVAMDGPPPDLELAMPPAEEVAAPLPVMPAAAETPPAIPLDTLPAAEPVAAIPSPEDLLPAAESAPVPPPESLAPAAEAAPMPPPESLAPAIEAAPALPITPAMPANEADDNGDNLSGLEAMPANESDDNGDDLSGLDSLDDVAGMETDDDLAGLPDDAAAPISIPPVNLPPGTPSPNAAPSSVAAAAEPYAMPAAGPSASPTPYQPTGYQPTTPRPTASTTSTTYAARPTPPAMGTPPSTATGARSLSMPRAKIESISGFVTDNVKIEEKDILPEDTKFDQGDYILTVEKRAEVEHDEKVARKVIRYIGPERRENLDKEIEQLYKDVSDKLNDDPDEVTAALKILREAQDIVFEDARQYDEALYRVATVRAMLAHKRNLGRWSYTWGIFVFFYAVVWLGAFIAALVYVTLYFTEFANLLGADAPLNSARLAFTSAAAGGIGGVCGILYSLYWHVSHKRDFNPQYIMYYLTQPILGFVLGALIYFITAAGFLVIDKTTGGDSLNSTVAIALQIALGWFAGFRQRVVLEMVEKIMRRLLGGSKDSNQEPGQSQDTNLATEPSEKANA